MNKTGLYVIVICMVCGYVFQPVLHPLVVRHLGVTVNEEELIKLVDEFRAIVKSTKEKVLGVKEQFEESQDKNDTGQYASPAHDRGTAQANVKVTDAEEGLLTVVDAMKLRLRDAATSKFGYVDVLEWHDVGAIKIDGVLYREGQILVKMQTVMGENVHRVQAILDGNEVMQWALVSTRERVM